VKPDLVNIGHPIALSTADEGREPDSLADQSITSPLIRRFAFQSPPHQGPG